MTYLSAFYYCLSASRVGLTVEFYRTFWPQIGDLVFKSIQNAYLSGTLSHSQRRGILRLLPKHEKDLLQTTGFFSDSSAFLLLATSYHERWC